MQNLVVELKKILRFEKCKAILQFHSFEMSKKYALVPGQKWWGCCQQSRRQQVVVSDNFLEPRSDGW